MCCQDFRLFLSAVSRRVLDGPPLYALRKQRKSIRRCETYWLSHTLGCTTSRSAFSGASAVNEERPYIFTSHPCCLHTKYQPVVFDKLSYRPSSLTWYLLVEASTLPPKNWGRPCRRVRVLNRIRSPPLRLPCHALWSNRSVLAHHQIVTNSPPGRLNPVGTGHHYLNINVFKLYEANKPQKTGGGLRLL